MCICAQTHVLQDNCNWFEQNDRKSDAASKSKAEAHSRTVEGPLLFRMLRRRVWPGSNGSDPFLGTRVLWPSLMMKVPLVLVSNTVKDGPPYAQDGFMLGPAACGKGGLSHAVSGGAKAGNACTLSR